VFGGETEDRLWVVKRDHNEESSAGRAASVQELESYRTGNPKRTQITRLHCQCIAKRETEIPTHNDSAIRMSSGTLAIDLRADEGGPCKLIV
jgi:hypothetical protein